MEPIQLVLLIGLGLSLFGLALGWLLRGHSPRLASISHLSAAAFVRVLGAVAAAWGAAGALGHDGALHIALSAFLALIALALLTSSALLVYVLIKGSPEVHDRA
jgi:hypothetical protein